MLNDFDIIINDLEFSYDRPILKIQELKILKNAKVFIYAPSGYGKTTLLSLLCGTLKSQSGSIDILGTDITRLSEQKKDLFRGTNIGHIFQQFNLINYLNIEENIKIPLTINPDRNKYENQHQQYPELIQALGLSHLQAKFPSELSVGEQQRVASARALIGGPQIIIADEPTSSLDEDNKNAFVEKLIDISKDKTVVFVSHDQTLKKYFDQIVNLKEINLV